MGKFYWNRETKRLEKPGCGCETRSHRCNQGICNGQWGIQHINVACGFIYSIFSEIKRITETQKSQTRFARIAWNEGDVEHRDIGLLLDDTVLTELVRELDLKISKEKTLREIAEGKFTGRFDPTV